MSEGTQPTSEAGSGRSLREEFFNLPNMLTMARIVLIAPVIILMLLATPVGNFFAALLFGVAAATDWLDGYLARRQNKVSVLGKLLDPMADKLIVMAVLVVAAQLGHIPGWFVILLLSRELAISGLRAVASQEGLMIHVVQAGKWKTACQLTGLAAVIVSDTYRIDFLFTVQDVNFNAMGFALLVIALAFSLVSASIYFGRFVAAIGAKRGQG